MQQLLKAISALVSIVSSDRVAALAARISNLDASKGGSLSANVQSAQASGSLKMLIEAWKVSTIDGRTLAAMLLAASDAYRLAESNQQVELVWTGSAVHHQLRRLRHRIRRQSTEIGGRAGCPNRFPGGDVERTRRESQYGPNRQPAQDRSQCELLRLEEQSRGFREWQRACEGRRR